MKDFPWKNIGGATAAMTQKTMWTCGQKKKENKEKVSFDP